MHNPTDSELGFGRTVIGPGETLPNASLDDAARVWYMRHGCIDNESSTPEPVIVSTTTLDDIDEPPKPARMPKRRKYGKD